MKRRSWLDRLFSLSLYLYPRDFRQQFGEEMREVFRQQCQRQHNRLHQIGELLLDNLRAVPAEHGRAFAQRGITRVQTLTMLTMISAATYGYFVYSLGGPSQTYETMKNIAANTASGMANMPLVLAVRGSNQHRFERALRLFDSVDRSKRLVAALMFANNQRTPGRISETPNLEHDAKVLSVVEETLAASSDTMELQMATIACFRQVGCLPQRITSRLTMLDGNNAVAWLLHAEALLASSPEQAAEALVKASTASSYQSIGEHPLRLWLEAVREDPYQTSWWQADDHRLHDWAEVMSGFTLGFQPISVCAEQSPAPIICEQLARRWHHAADTQQERSRWSAVLAKQDPSTKNEVEEVLDRNRSGWRALDIAMWDGQLSMEALSTRLNSSNDLVAIGLSLPLKPRSCPMNEICGEDDLPFPFRSPNDMARPLQPVR